jgi:hypothetical protein
VALASPELVRCDAAKKEIFTAAKKSAATEFLYPWHRAFPEGARADWSKATECYRSYREPGYAIYGASVAGEVVVLEVWWVPEVI